MRRSRLLLMCGIVLRLALLAGIFLMVLHTITQQGTPHTMTQTSPTQGINATLGAWIYPDKPGSPACSAAAEYSDGRQVNVLKPQYYTFNDNGTLTQITASAQCNGYSPVNAADVKAHSQQQFVTISGYNKVLSAFSANPDVQIADINTLVSFVESINFTGIELDLEGYGAWTPQQYAQYKYLVTLLGSALHSAHKLLMIDGPIIMNATYQGYYQWKYEDFEDLPVDYIVAMCYDLQADLGNGTPVSSLQDITSCCAWLKARISDPNRLVIGLPSYGYMGVTAAYEAREISASQAAQQPGYTTAKRDPASGEMTWQVGNTSYDYSDSTTMNMKLQAVLASGIQSVSVWALGGGNPWFSPAKSSPSQPTTPTQTSDAALVAFTEKYPGFDSWYSKHFDTQGNYLG